MSFGLIDTEVRHQMHEVRRQFTRARARRPARTGPGVAAPGDRRHRRGLRRRIGFTLVETGLRLLVSGQAHG